MTTTEKPIATTKSKSRAPRTPRAQTPPRPAKVRRLDGHLYWVESERYPGTGHQTTPFSCTCPAGRHGRLCRHQKIVRAVHAWRLEQLALAAPSAPLLAWQQEHPLARHFE